MIKSATGELRPPRPGGHVFTFKEKEHPEGGEPRTITFTDVDIKPRGYDELEAAQLGEPITIPLEMYNGRILETNAEGVDLSQYAHFTTTLESPFTAHAIGLVRGGWLPSALAATRENAVVFPDRNIITEVVSRFEGGRSRGRNPDFLDLFEGRPIKINPMIAVMEGNGRALQTPDQMRQQLDEAVGKLTRALPQAKLMVGPGSVQGLQGVMENKRRAFERDRALLKAMAPSISRPVAWRDIDTRWTAILAAADAHEVPRASFLVLALLSALVHPRGRCAAKRLLKPHDGYGDTHAHNALSDLRALEMLLHCLAVFPDFETQLCTKDRQLALFWVGAGISEIEQVGTSVRCSITPHPAILPEPYAERWAKAIAITP